MDDQKVAELYLKVISWYFLLFGAALYRIPFTEHIPTPLLGLIRSLQGGISFALFLPSFLFPFPAQAYKWMTNPEGGPLVVGSFQTENVINLLVAFAIALSIIALVSLKRYKRNKQWLLVWLVIILTGIAIIINNFYADASLIICAVHFIFLVTLLAALIYMYKGATVKE